MNVTTVLSLAASFGACIWRIFDFRHDVDHAQGARSATDMHRHKSGLELDFLNPHTATTAFKLPRLPVYPTLRCCFLELHPLRHTLVLLQFERISV